MNDEFLPQQGRASENSGFLNVSETSVFGNHQTLSPFKETDLSLSNGEDTQKTLEKL